MRASSRIVEVRRGEVMPRTSSERTAPLSSPAEGKSPIAVQLRILNAPASPVCFQLSEGACCIGAGQGVDVLVDDSTVSRRHAKFELVREGVAVTDLRSRNGVFLHEQRIEKAILSPGSRVRLGRVEVEIHADLSPELLPPSTSPRYGRLMGESAAMRRVFSLLGKLEGSLVNVLVAGETGTGKELAARAIHDRSHVASGPFVSINCGALERNLARSELFGHARGAFTGAVDSRPGAFEAANSGTLFLDEIGELPLEVQPMLLRALEQGVVVRVGETQERPVKVRLIAATHRDLFQLVKLERFREDLLYRLMVVKVTLPPLRERAEDVAFLIRHFAREFGAPPLSDDAIEHLANARYPGNVRELRNVVQAYAALGTLPESRGEDDPDAAASLWLWRHINLKRPYAEQKEELLKSFLELYLERLLAHTGGNQTEAARISGLERSYLNRVLKRRNLPH